MDRATGLEALAEEDDEEYVISDGSLSEDDVSRGDAITKIEPNKFDGLCDGVINANSLVHASINELLELKEDLVRQALPPNVLMKIVLCVTKVFRSFSDFQSPVNELLRMVRLYSTPWEEKSAALKKLHEDYNSKKEHLNIAVKRLQLIDSHSRTIAKEKKILNWEKLYSKLTTARGHGRRWKFLIGSFKEKHTESPEAFQHYLEEVEVTPESNSKEQTLPSEPKTLPAFQSEKSFSVTQNQDITDNEDSSENESEVEEFDNNSLPSEKKESVVSLPKVISTIDKASWTHEPVYERFLNMKIYKPEGLEHKELKCFVTCGQMLVKTDIFDDFVKGNQKDVRGKGSLKQRPGGALGRPAERVQEESYAYVKMPLPEASEKICIPTGKQAHIQQEEKLHVQIGVRSGPKEELIALATIKEHDLMALDIPIIYEESVQEDNDNNEPKEAGNLQRVQCSDMQPVKFPLYSIFAGKSDSMHASNGVVPITCYWSKVNQPHSSHKATEIVEDSLLPSTEPQESLEVMEDVPKETRDQCTSVMSNFIERPENSELDDQEDENKEKLTVSLMEYEHMIMLHNKQIAEIEEEYEQKLQSLVDQFQNIQETMLQAQSASNSPQPVVIRKTERAVAERNTSSADVRFHKQPKSGTDSHAVMNSNFTEKRNFETGRLLPNWGENLPANFLDRLKLFEEEAKVHKEDNILKTNKKIQEMLEKKIAAEHKLHCPQSEVKNSMEDITLPAVFMPTLNNSKKAIFNPRATKHFHPNGSSQSRLTQPPSMLQLPPLPNNKLSVLNLFDVSNNFNHVSGNQWLSEQYSEKRQPVKTVILTSGYKSKDESFTQNERKMKEATIE